jgi:hypothetical protein
MADRDFTNEALSNITSFYDRICQDPFSSEDSREFLSDVPGVTSLLDSTSQDQEFKQTLMNGHKHATRAIFASVRSYDAVAGNELLASTMTQIDDLNSFITQLGGLMHIGDYPEQCLMLGDIGALAAAFDAASSDLRNHLMGQLRTVGDDGCFVYDWDSIEALAQKDPSELTELELRTLADLLSMMDADAMTMFFQRMARRVEDVEKGLNIFLSESYSSWVFDPDTIAGIAYYLNPSRSTMYAQLLGEEFGATLPLDFERAGIYGEMQGLRYYPGGENRFMYADQWWLHLNTLEAMLTVLPALGASSGKGITSELGASYPPITITRNGDNREYIIGYSALRLGGNAISAGTGNPFHSLYPLSGQYLHIGDARRASEVSKNINGYVNDSLKEYFVPDGKDIPSFISSLLGDGIEIPMLPIDVLFEIGDAFERLSLVDMLDTTQVMQDNLTGVLDDLDYNAVLIYGSEYPNGGITVGIYEGDDSASRLKRLNDVIASKPSIGLPEVTPDSLRERPSEYSNLINTDGDAARAVGETPKN